MKLLTRIGVFSAVTATAVAAAGLAAAGAALSPTARSCPSAAVVDAALGEKGKTPVATTTRYSKSCTYPGSGIVPTKVTFQVDTSATFAASEQGAQAVGVVAVHGLGKAAYATKGSGSLYVFDGHETIKILAPLVSTAKLETLARKLL